MFLYLFPFIAGHIQGEIVAAGVGNRFPSLRAARSRRGAAFISALLACSALEIAGLAAHAHHAEAGAAPPADGSLVALARALGLDGGALPAIALAAGIALQCVLGTARLPRAMSCALLSVSALVFAALAYTNLAGFVNEEIVWLYGAYAAGMLSGIVRTMCPRLTRMRGALGGALRAQAA